MKVLQLIKTAHGATWGYRQVREVIQRGIEVHVALPEGPMTEKYQAAGATIHIMQPSIALKAPWKNRALSKALRTLIDEIQPDLVHSHFVATTLLARLAMKKYSIPILFQVPGPLHLEHALFRALDLRSASKKDYWVGSCQWTVDCYRRHGIAAERLGLSYYGIDSDAFQEKKKKAVGNIREELGLVPDTKIVGMVAHFYGPKYFLGQRRGLKGHEDLIDAMCALQSERPDLHCAIIGGPWGNSSRYFERVKRYAQRNGAKN